MTTVEQRKFKITNFDCDGNKINDLSKVVLPPDLSLMILSIISKEEKQ